LGVFELYTGRRACPRCRCVRSTRSLRSTPGLDFGSSRSSWRTGVDGRRVCALARARSVRCGTRPDTPRRPTRVMKTQTGAEDDAGTGQDRRTTLRGLRGLRGCASRSRGRSPVCLGHSRIPLALCSPSNPANHAKLRFAGIFSAGFGAVICGVLRGLAVVRDTAPPTAKAA
jgi:hypothetical protein